ncbi:MAG: hypothetical protein M3N50_14015 [Pseudomonadota bacterium]|nr:hypothetical protein [Pseudomonadota bacterium]
MNPNALAHGHSLLAALAVIAAAVLGSTMGSNAVGQTPEQTKMWEAQHAQASADDKAKSALLAQQRQARKRDPMAWVRTLDPMSAGGWTFRSVAADGSWASFSTDHQMKRSRHEITVWLRQEYPEAQKNPGGDIYWSNVEKTQYDCAKERARELLVIYYSENNLAGAQQSEEADPKTAAWEPIVPGTQSEYIFQWACAAGNTPR